MFPVKAPEKEDRFKGLLASEECSLCKKKRFGFFFKILKYRSQIEHKPLFANVSVLLRYKSKILNHAEV